MENKMKCKKRNNKKKTNKLPIPIFTFFFCQNLALRLIQQKIGISFSLDAYMLYKTSEVPFQNSTDT